MPLTDIQFCRVAAFVLGLRLIHETLPPLTQGQIDGTEAIPPLDVNRKGGRSKSVTDRLAELTEIRANTLAIELGVSFPDETEREENPFNREEADAQLEREILRSDEEITDEEILKEIEAE